MALFSLQLGEDEKVLTIIREHWVTLLGILLRFVIILAVLVSFYYFFPDNHWKLVVAFVLGGLDFIFLLDKLIVWHLGSVMITNQRIIDINQQSLNKRIIVEALIGDITEVLFFKEGIFQKLFRIGTLVIEIKGGGKIISFCAKDPKRLADEINKLKYRNEQSGSKLEKVS